jgi:ubiquinone/menaquinone biosynthesis C-methylase UbiE
MPRRRDYNAASYVESTYKEEHKQAYLRVRNEALGELIAELKRSRGRLRTLEIACGPGFSLVHLTRKSPDDLLVGMDRSADMLQLSQTHVAAAGGTSRLVRATALRLPFAAGTFDVVFATRFIHIYPDKTSVIEELRRVVRPGGLLIIEFYGRPYHLLAFAVRRLKCSWQQFQWQYPRLAHVRSVMVDVPRLIPVRLGGERWLRRVLGEPLLRFCRQHASHTPLQLLVAEYFAVSVGNWSQISVADPMRKDVCER